LLAISPCYAALQHLQVADEKILDAHRAATVHIARMPAAPTFTAQSDGA